MCNEFLSFNKEVAIKMLVEENRYSRKQDSGPEGADISRCVNQSTMTLDHSLE